MISPITAAIILPFESLYKIPERAAPNTAPVSASGGIPIVAILMTPIKTAHVNEYTGPINTAHVILIRCAIGHIPSTRRIGEITTPSATNIASVTIFSNTF